MTTTASLLAAESAKYLQETFMARLARALETLPEGDLFWAPHPGVLTVGNILLHLQGNVRQWICSGIGGAPDERERASEFAATADTETADSAELLARLSATVNEAVGIIGEMDAEAFERTYSIQSYDVTGVFAVTHVFEHFAWHTGQAVWIAKARAGASHGLAFYDEAKVNSARNG